MHLHLSRETIARTGLELIDRDGLEALTLRNIASELSVGVTTLYGHVRTRDEIVSDVVGLLLGEVDTTARSGEVWEEVLRRVATSVRAVAHRHPAAFTLVATAPVDEAPVLDYARAIEEASVAGGISEQRFIESWQVVDAFLTGFLMMEATALTRARAAEADDAGTTSDAFRGDMSKVHSDAAFAAALEIIIAGLRQKWGRE